MEQRLAEFREARKRAALVAQPSTTSQGEQTSAAKAEPAAATPKAAPGWLRRFLTGKASPAITRARPSQVQEAAQQPPQSPAVPLPSSRHQSLLTNITFLKVLLWLVLLGLFVELEFGLAYFVLSMFYWMYVGTRGPGERKEGEKSAYSVFNPGCEAIQGTLTAEQLERELQLRPPRGR
ncbi:SAYSvFN domain-containing protein 1 [Peromyscus maniculatus bairdii]|uniref:SAYSvFN domain-containing protein 1 n=1 Tax=Peromyscus maniculatus bairdii TaxID=230844 RepID=UPI00042AF438|nr:SAYSvFN domain-containing protein 1 isoform X2 [Peromyscus maniculatus bairdii]